MTDEQAKILARALVEETLRKAGRKDVTIHRVYLIPDRKLYVVVMIFGQTLRRLSGRRADGRRRPGTPYGAAVIYSTTP